MTVEYEGIKEDSVDYEGYNKSIKKSYEDNDYLIFSNSNSTSNESYPFYIINEYKEKILLPRGTSTNYVVSNKHHDTRYPKDISDYKKAWIITRIGKKVCPLDPDPESLDILDIAWALSGEGRFANHCKDSYTVGQHCCLLAHYIINNWRELSYCNVDNYKAIAYDLLMHDNTEAYMKDLPYLVKPFFPNYKEREDNLMKVSSIRFKFNSNNEIVHLLDRKIAAAEIKQLMPSVLEFENLTHDPLNIQIKPWSRYESFITFVNLYKELAPEDAPKVDTEKYQELKMSFFPNVKDNINV